MSEISELKKKIDKNAEISRASHFQTKGRLSKLEKDCSNLIDKITKLNENESDIEELKEEMNNLKRGLKNLWNDFKEFQFKYESKKAS